MLCLFRETSSRSSFEAILAQPQNVEGSHVVVGVRFLPHNRDIDTSTMLLINGVRAWIGNRGVPATARPRTRRAWATATTTFT